MSPITLTISQLLGSLTGAYVLGTATTVLIYLYVHRDER